jgi:hypothetical protein
MATLQSIRARERKAHLPQRSPFVNLRESFNALMKYHGDNAEKSRKKN